jgi:hypothetical protein
MLYLYVIALYLLQCAKYCIISVKDYIIINSIVNYLVARRGIKNRNQNRIHYIYYYSKILSFSYNRITNN